MACRVGSSPILLALLSLSGLPIAQAQQAQAQSGANKLALVVGIDDYADPGLSRLRYAAKDAADIASAMRNLGFSVNALTGREATRSEILRAVRSLIERSGPDGLVLVYFSGHGFSVGGKEYLAASDTESHASVRSALSVQELQHQMQSAPGKNILILDACDSGLAASKSSAYRSPKWGGPGSSSFALYSTTADGVSYESDALNHGLFTYHVLRALHGEAAEGSAPITWRGLTEYVARAVSSEMRSRGLAQSSVSSSGSGDFILGISNGELSKTDAVASIPAKRSGHEDAAVLSVSSLPNTDTSPPNVSGLFNLYQILSPLEASSLASRASTVADASRPAGGVALSGPFCVNPAGITGGQNGGGDAYSGISKAPDAYIPLLTPCGGSQPGIASVLVQRVRPANRISVEGSAADTQAVEILVRAHDAATPWRLMPDGSGWSTALSVGGFSGAHIAVPNERSPYLMTAAHVMHRSDRVIRYEYDARNRLTSLGLDAGAISSMFYSYDALSPHARQLSDARFLLAQMFAPRSGNEFYNDRSPPEKLRALSTFSDVERQEMMRVWDHAVRTGQLAAFRRVCELYPGTVYYTMAEEEMARITYGADTLRPKGPSAADPAHFAWDDKIAAFGFGTLFVSIMLVLAVWIREPTPTQWFVFRVVLSLAAAGIGAIIPGLIQVDIHPYIRAGGAIALFVIVYWFNPPKLVASGEPVAVRRTVRRVNPTPPGN